MAARLQARRKEDMQRGVVTVAVRYAMLTPGYTERPRQYIHPQEHAQPYAVRSAACATREKRRVFYAFRCVCLPRSPAHAVPAFSKCGVMQHGERRDEESEVKERDKMFACAPVDSYGSFAEESEDRREIGDSVLVTPVSMSASRLPYQRRVTHASSPVGPRWRHRAACLRSVVVTSRRCSQRATRVPPRRFPGGRRAAQMSPVRVAPPRAAPGSAEALRYRYGESRCYR